MVKSFKTKPTEKISVGLMLNQCTCTCTFTMYMCFISEFLWANLKLFNLQNKRWKQHNFKLHDFVYSMKTYSAWYTCYESIECVLLIKFSLPVVYLCCIFVSIYVIWSYVH